MLWVKPVQVFPLMANMTLDGYLITEEMILWLSLKQEENFAWEWHQTRNH